MAGVVISNPRDCSVRVQIIGKGGFLGLGSVNKTINIAAGDNEVVTVPKGSYHIRFSFEDSSGIWEGDSFVLDADSVSQIVLQETKNGNYTVRRTG